MLGERLKVKVTAPPEHGRANQAVCALLAQFFQVPASAVDIISGHSSSEKVASIAGVAQEDVLRRITHG